jgi:hypothetical protein
MEAVNRSLIVCILALSQSAFATEVQFDDLRTNFKQYDRQQVTVKGILEVAGNDNYLYRDIQGRERQRVWIHVLPDLNRPDSAGGLAPDAPANLHWVKVTGVIDASFHGHFGNEPFGLRQTKIELLTGPRLKQFLSTLAWFKNESRHNVGIEIDAGRWATSFDLEPGEVGSADMYKGTNNVTVTTKDGKVLTKLKFDNVQPSHSYDRQRHAYYFRITNREITPVPPTEARNWKFAPTPERD